MCNYREPSREELAVFKVLADWRREDRLGLQRDFQGNAELMTLSRGLPSKIALTGFIQDPHRGGGTTQIEFEVVSGRGGFYEGEKFRLSPRMAAALYEKTPAVG